MKEKLNPDNCTERVFPDRWVRGYQCSNKKKFGDKCGIHDKEQQAKRRAARGPTQFERDMERNHDERRRVENLELENAVLSMIVKKRIRMYRDAHLFTLSAESVLDDWRVMAISDLKTLKKAAKR